MATRDWRKKLTAFDAQLCNMVENLTGESCEPVHQSREHGYTIIVRYGKFEAPDKKAALWEAIAGRIGKRLGKVTDDEQNKIFFVKVKFYKDRCKDAAFVPKIERKKD